MTPRIQKAIDIFLDAINEGTLAKGTCTACAVGNLVAHGMGAKINYSSGFGYRALDPNGRTVNNQKWSYFFITYRDGIRKGGLLGRVRSFSEIARFPDLQEAIDNIGFTLEELSQIEYAFETNTEIAFENYWKNTPEDIRADQIRGLEAVVKVMLKFDEQEDDVKEVFTSKAELIPC